MNGISLPGLDGSSAEVPMLYILYGLVRQLKPSLIVEAGTYMGHATTIMAAALRDEKLDGEVWSADPVDYGAQKVLDDNGLSGYAKLYRGDFADMLNGPLAGRNARLAFIDSGPVHGSIETLTSIRIMHFNAALNRVRSDGLLVVDDAVGDWVGVEHVRNLPGIYLPQGRGLKLVQGTV